MKTGFASQELLCVAEKTLEWNIYMTLRMFYLSYVPLPLRSLA
jgi:hypothetical protein